MHPLNPICPLHPIISPLENTHRFTHIKYSNALAWNLDMTGWIGRKTPRHSSPARVPCFPASRFQDTLQAERPESIAALGLHKQSESFPGIPRSCPQIFSTFVGFSTPKKHNIYPQGQITIYCFTFSIWMLIPFDNFSASQLRWCRWDVGCPGKRSTDGVSQVLALFVRLLHAQPGLHVTRIPIIPCHPDKFPQRIESGIIQHFDLAMTFINITPIWCLIQGIANRKWVRTLVIPGHCLNLPRRTI